jgi:iron complex outermembrane receptor protein/vitamin B12 transporter
LLDSLRFDCVRSCARWLLLLVLAACGPALQAVSVRGSVFDPLGRPIASAIVALIDNGQVVVTVRSGADGSYQMSTGSVGRFYVLATGTSFRQVATESFYGAALESVVKNITLEPETLREAIVVTATGTPVPLAQVSASITRLGSLDFENFANVTNALQTVPGFHLVETGERGGQTSLFIRGGDSDANKVLLDGVPLEDIGGTFDFANLSTTGIASAEAYRGPNSVLFGADAGAGVVALTTPRGSTPFPSVIYDGDGGNFGTYRNQVQGGGTHNALDYYGGFSDLQTTNSLAGDTYHDVTSSANFGYALDTRTNLRVSARDSVSATGVPGQYVFTRVANDAKQNDQNIFLSGVLDHTFSDSWHGLLNYGLARKREQFDQYSPTGEYVADEGVYLGQQVTVTGANGYSVSGQSILNYAGTYPAASNSASNRDSLYAQTDKEITPHLTAVAGFRYENERGAYRYPVYGINEAVERTNYDYTLEFQGDLRNRLFYTLGGGVEKNQLYGTVGAPHVGASYYLVRPGAGRIHGTRLNFNFSKGYKEPTLFEQNDSLYAFLLANGGSPTVNSYQVKPIGAELTRSYDGGAEQSLFNERVVVSATYFHNEFGNEIESVPAGEVPLLLPNLSAAQQMSLKALLTSSYESPDLNSLSFRAQGMESEVQYGLRRNIFLRGGYTYLDTRVQRSFSSSALSPYYADSAFPTIAIGAGSPLVGARVFRRPPHTGFLAATYTDGKGKWNAVVSGSFASRSDDSTDQEYNDANFGNSLLLPNRNLDSAYANINLGATYNIKSWGAVYTQLDNLLSQQHVSPIGYLSQPFSARAGVRVTLGKSAK